MSTEFSKVSGVVEETDPVAIPEVAAEAEARANADLAEETARKAADATLTTAVAGKAASSHTHAQSDVTGLASALSAKQDASTAATDSELAAAVLVEKERAETAEATKAAASHTHAQSDVTGLVAALAAKQDSSSAATDSELATEKSERETADGLKASKTELSTEKTERESAVSTEKSRAETAEALKLAKASNLSDLANAGTARTNLGLGTAATKAESAFAAASHTHAQSEVTGLVAALEAKAASTDSRFPALAALSANVGPIKEQTTLQNITGLGVVIGASSTEMWRITYWLEFEAANVTMDVKIGFTFPTGCTGRWAGLGGSAGGAGFPSWGPTGTGNNPGLLNSLNESQALASREGIFGIPLVVKVFGGGTAGTVQIQYAQNTSNASNLTVLKGSVVEAQKVAA